MSVPLSSRSTSALPLIPDRPQAPPLVQLESPVTDAVAWLADRRDDLRALVAERGSVVVRGLGLSGVEQFADLVATLSTDLLGDEEAFAQRRRRAPGIFSSASWPDQERMCMHHELSYRSPAPGLLVLGCLRAPDRGGETGLADAADVYAALPPALVERFAAEGWLLLRNYGEDIGPSLTDAFGTDDRARIEQYCRANAIEYSWRPDGGLSTRQRRPAVVRHPVTGRDCWFNQVAFLSEWTIDPEIREFLVDMYGADGLPFTTAVGNGDPIDAGVIELLNATYQDHTVSEPWQTGDLMVVDNIGTAHSREAFEGEREILVALAEPVRLEAGAR